MLLAKKKRIIYNGSEYFITIRKSYNILDIIFFPITIIFGLDKYYKIKIYTLNDNELFDLPLLLYKKILKLKVNGSKFNNDIDKVMNYSFEQLNKYLEETKYINNYDTSYMIDTEWKEKLYKSFYKEVINDLKEKGLIDKELFTDIKVDEKPKQTSSAIRKV